MAMQAPHTALPPGTQATTSHMPLLVKSLSRYPLPLVLVRKGLRGLFKTLGMRRGPCLDGSACSLYRSRTLFPPLRTALLTERIHT